LVDVLIELRKEARARKDFATGDAIRDRLKEIGVVLEDTKEGTRWTLAR
ncbi:MAG TPA: cysteine--tRNA ligase, partial [Candidatus Kapabacteria bacterium]|nr:cysteine--tRNA ligase [Candidatus Kapabacteria bacterium]